MDKKFEEMGILEMAKTLGDMGDKLKKEEMLPCHCGRTPELKVTIGGPTLYFGIYCLCGNSNRHYDSSIARIGIGIGNFPPKNKETAIKDWNELYARHPEVQ